MQHLKIAFLLFLLGVVIHANRVDEYLEDDRIEDISEGIREKKESSEDQLLKNIMRLEANSRYPLIIYATTLSTKMSIDLFRQLQSSSNQEKQLSMRVQDLRAHLKLEMPELSWAGAANSEVLLYESNQFIIFKDIQGNTIEFFGI